MFLWPFFNPDFDGLSLQLFPTAVVDDHFRRLLLMAIFMTVLTTNLLINFFMIFFVAIFVQLFRQIEMDLWK